MYSPAQPVLRPPAEPSLLFQHPPLSLPDPPSLICRPPSVSRDPLAPSPSPQPALRVPMAERGNPVERYRPAEMVLTNR